VTLERPHRADLDDLLKAKEMCGNTAVDGVGKLHVVFLVRFGDGGGVDSGLRAKRVAADNGIVRRNHCVRGTRDCFGIFLKL